MRVLHILSSPSSGGAEAFVKDMVLNSRQSGIEPAIVFTSSSGNLGRSADYESKVLGELVAQNIPHVVLPGNSRRNPLEGRKAFKSFVAQFAPDCIHSHLQVGLLYCVLFCRSISRVYTHHSSVVNSSHFVFKQLMRLCDRHIAISMRCADFLNPFLPRKKEAHVVYNAIDTNRLAHEKSTATQTRLRLIAVGRVAPAKNYPLMLEAIGEVKASVGSDFVLRIAGEASDSQRQTLMELIAQYDIADVVELLGNRSDIAALLAESDLFLMSSAWEGLPIALLEAQMAGLPALVTNVGGCIEVLEITQGGIAVEPGNVTAYKDALIDLINHPEKRDLYSSNAVQHREFFSIENCVKKHKEVYTLAVGNVAP